MWISATRRGEIFETLTEYTKLQTVQCSVNVQVNIYYYKASTAMTVYVFNGKSKNKNVERQSRIYVVLRQTVFTHERTMYDIKRYGSNKSPQFESKIPRWGARKAVLYSGGNRPYYWVLIST